MRRARFAALAGVLSAAVAACSGNSVGMTKTDYIGRAGAICRDASDAVRKVKPDASTPRSVAASIEQVVIIERAAAQQLRSLRPPTGDAPALAQWLRFVDDSIKELDVARAAAARGDAAGATAANVRSNALQQQADAAAQQYGVTACVAPPK
jgi:hypothetical protein